MRDPLPLNIKKFTVLDRQQIEALSREFANVIYMGDHLLLCKVLARYKLFIDSRDLSLTPHLSMDGFWESWITRFFMKIIKPGFVCIDAGANFGYYSLLFSELAGREGKTIAIEANSELCRLLRNTSAVNEFGFHVVHKAVADTEKEMILSVPGNFWGGGHLIKEINTASNEAQEKVTANSLDHIVEYLQLPRVDLVKIDCEGQEPVVLKGMTKILEQNPHVKIAMEYSPSIYEDKDSFTDFLFSKFTIGEIQGDSTVKSYTVKDKNYLLNLPGHTDLFLELKR